MEKIDTKKQLELVRDQLKSLQDGEYACMEYKHALMFVEEALKWLNRKAEEQMRGWTRD